MYTSAMSEVALKRRRTDYLRVSGQAVEQYEREFPSTALEAVKDQMRADLHMQFFYGGLYVLYGYRLVDVEGVQRSLRTIYAIGNDTRAINEEFKEFLERGDCKREEVLLTFVHDAYSEND